MIPGHQKEKKVDPLISVSQAHNKIFEMSNMYEKLLQGVSFIDVAGYVNTLSKLFKESIIPHFDFEENRIFPAALASRDPKIRSLVTRIQDDHDRLLAKLTQLNGQKINLGDFSKVTQKEKNELLSSCTALTRELTSHAQYEDTEFYPLISGVIFKMD